MSAPLAQRVLGAAVLVVVFAVLGSAFALGRSLGPAPVAEPGSPSSEAGRHVDQPAPARSTGQPPTDAPSPDHSSDHGPGRSPDQGPGRDDPGDQPGENGPYGTLDSTGTGSVALTFDDGPDPRYTPQALRVLRAYGVKATFCLVGENALAHPDLVREIAADGHTLCNHSWNHDFRLGSRSYQAIQADLIRTNEAIRAAVPGARIAYFRQPGGAWTYPVVRTARDLGMNPLHWTVDPSDWRAPGAAVVVDRIIARIEPGSIVLLHDAGGDRQGTVDALWTLLPALTSRYHVTALPPDL